MTYVEKTSYFEIALPGHTLNLKGLNSIKTVYELFDNPSYILFNIEICVNSLSLSE